MEAGGGTATAIFIAFSLFHRVVIINYMIKIKTNKINLIRRLIMEILKKAYKLSEKLFSSITQFIDDKYSEEHLSEK